MTAAKRKASVRAKTPKPPRIFTQLDVSKAVDKTLSESATFYARERFAWLLEMALADAKVVHARAPELLPAAFVEALDCFHELLRDTVDTTGVAGGGSSLSVTPFGYEGRCGEWADDRGIVLRLVPSAPKGGAR